jgi:histidinol-phosphate aminotransferase
VVDLVDSHGDLLVLRTFSKLYGMAGLRMGLAIAQPPVLDRLLARSGAPSPRSPGSRAARTQRGRRVARARPAGRIPKQAREETFAFLTKYGYGFHPSQSNCFMLDAKRPAAELAAAHGAAQRAHRPDVAGLAQLRSRHDWDAG